jgi:hypothetical protein
MEAKVSPTTTLLSANIVLCETVINENTGTQTIVRQFSHINLAPDSESAHFFALTILASQPGDQSPHALQMRMVDRQGRAVIVVPDFPFVYAFKTDPTGPGGFSLKTEFTVDLTKLVSLGTFLVQAWLDGVWVAQTPITLRRR